MNRRPPQPTVIVSGRHKARMTLLAQSCERAVNASTIAATSKKIDGAVAWSLKAVQVLVCVHISSPLPDLRKIKRTIQPRGVSKYPSRLLAPAIKQVETRISFNCRCFCHAPVLRCRAPQTHNRPSKIRPSPCPTRFD